MATIQVNVPSPTLNMNGNTTINSTMSWSVPSLPEGADGWTGAVLSGTWTWNGKGSVTTLTLGGTSTSNAMPFSHTLTATELQNGSVAISARGGNKNVTGNNFTWSDLIVVYEYTIPVISPLRIKQGGTWITVQSVYKKIGGVWVEQSDIGSLFDASTKYIRKG